MANRLKLLAIVAYHHGGVAYRQTSPFFAHQIGVKEIIKLILTGRTGEVLGNFPLPGRYILTDHKNSGHTIITKKALQDCYSQVTSPSTKPGWSTYQSNMHWVAYSFKEDFVIIFPTGEEVPCPNGHFLLDGVWEWRVVSPEELAQNYEMIP